MWCFLHVVPSSGYYTFNGYILHIIARLCFAHYCMVMFCTLLHGDKSKVPNRD